MTPAGEQRVDVDIWLRDGFPMRHHGRGRGLPKVSIGRTDSERGLGFRLLDPTGNEMAEFVLDRPQIENLHAYLGSQIRRLKRSRWTAPSLARMMAAGAKVRSAKARRRKATR